MKKQGLTTITINHINFSSKSVFFDLYGLINFNFCSFSVTEIGFFRGQYEPAPTEENVRSFQSHVTNKPINIYKSQFDDLKFIAYDTVARKVSIIDCEITHFDIRTYSNNVLCLLLLEISGSLLPSQVMLMESNEKLFLFINLFNINMFNLQILSGKPFKGKLGLHVENVTWENNNMGFLDLHNIVSVNISSSKLILSCDACSPMIINGMKIYRNSLEYYFKNDFDIFHQQILITIVYIIETSLKIHASLQDKISTETADIILINSKFLIANSVLFGIGSHYKITNSVIKCSAGKMAHRILSRTQMIYVCKPTCEGKDKYSLQSGSLTVSEVSKYDFISQVHNVHLLQENSVHPLCFPCPLGAKCEDQIQAVSDYWGYMIDNQSVSMIRCPDGYCCQGNETCKGFDSCNTGRIGNLCSRCKQKLTEALFTPKCMSTESCRSGLVTVIFFAAAIIYTVALLSFSTIKDLFVKFLKKIYTWCKQRFQHDKINQNNRKKQLSKENNATDESGMKYMQLLFYYVQDSKLFIVHLAEISVKSKNVVVEFLEFLPRILEAYVQATELCFMFTTAISKVVLQFSFGFLVIGFLFLIYLIQWIISHLVQRDLPLNALKMKLVQAFILTVLFSFQQVVMGAFTLVQCVVIRDQTILYVQADVQCYTWWQIGIVIYVCTFIVPIFFVMAHVPYCVKDRRMPVQSFILSCLFPFPVMLVHCIAWYKKRKCITIESLDKNGFETIEMVEIQPLEHTEESTKESSGKISFTS